MAIYTTFFLCEPAALQVGFPGWRAPLETPIRREVRNPFTGAVMTIESRAPEWPDDDEEIAELEYEAITIEGSYEDYLEGRLPPFVRDCPHWAAKGLTSIELESLLELLDVKESIEPAIYSPPSSGDSLEELPQALVARLPSIDVNTTANGWATVLSTPEYTHSTSGIKLSDGPEASAFAIILECLVSLSRQAGPGQRMYLLTEA